LIVSVNANSRFLQSLSALSFKKTLPIVRNGRVRVVPLTKGYCYDAIPVTDLIVRERSDQ